MLIKKLIFIFVLGFVPQLSVAAQNEPPKDSRTYERQAVKAYQAKEFPAFLENMKLAESLRPNHPRLLYNLSVAYTMNGKTNEAISTLNRLVEMKLFYDVEKDDDFAAIKNSTEFQQVVGKFQVNRKPTGKGELAFAVNEKGIVPEGLAYNGRTRTFYLSSVAGRKILSINAKGESKVFADQSSGLWSVFGIKVDEKRQLLWATSSAHKQMPGLIAEEDGQAGIFAFDLRTGKLVQKYLLPNTTARHLLGDLVVAQNGDVYATDSRSPVIYVIRSGKKEIETFGESNDFVSLQGLDLSKDGKFLFVADYSKGIFKIDLATKKPVSLAPPASSTLLGIDGIYFDGDSLVGIQNGVSPQRVIRLKLTKNLDKIEGLEVIEANNPLFDDITLGVFAQGQFYFIANSQWNLLGEEGKIAPPEKLKNIVVLRMP